MDNLPEELQEKIYEYVHKYRYDKVLNEMYTRYFCTIFKVGVLTPWAEYESDRSCGGMIFRSLKPIHSLTMVDFRRIIYTGDVYETMKTAWDVVREDWDEWD